jgi:hypothetical protein
MSEVLDVVAIGRALVRSSDEIKREVGALIDPAANDMVTRLKQRYPMGAKPHRDGTPHMRDDMGIRNITGSEPLLPVRKVRGPRLAYIWQDGTRRRYDATRKNAYRGISPPHDPGFFQRTAIQVRTAMLNKAQQILDRPREID